MFLGVTFCAWTGTALAYNPRMTPECDMYLHWPPGEEIPYYLNKRGCGDLPFARCEAAVKAAFDTVQNIDCTGVRFKYMGKTDAEQYLHNPVDTRDQQNIIVWYETWPPNSSTGETAVSTIWSLRNYDGTYLEFGVALNGETYQWADDLSAGTHDIQGVVTTQVLYALGLWHSTSDQSILDGSYATASDAKRTPLQDDIDGVCFLSPENPEPDHWDTSCTADQHCESGECVGGALSDAGQGPDGGERPDSGVQPDGGESADGGETPNLDAGETPADAGSVEDAGAGRDGGEVGPDSGRTAECRFNTDCFGDDICVDGRCASSDAVEVGCGCRTAGQGREWYPAVPSLLVLLGLARRRRARR